MQMADPDTILLIEDEPQIRQTVASALEERAMHVLHASTGREGIAIAAAQHLDLVVLDLGLPDVEGVEVCREIRRGSTAPIVVMSARRTEQEKVTLLTAGADDYVTKPFGMSEFLARIQAQLRRARTPHRTTLSVHEVDGLTIDLPKRIVRRGAQMLHLSPIEWSILRTLAIHAGRAVTHQQIFDAVWSREFGNPSHYLRVYITYLRRKIERDPASPRVILTEPGVGYRLGFTDD